MLQDSVVCRHEQRCDVGKKFAELDAVGALVRCTQEDDAVGGYLDGVMIFKRARAEVASEWIRAYAR